MNVHYPINSGECSYLCSICLKAFYDSGNLSDSVENCQDTSPSDLNEAQEPQALSARPENLSPAMEAKTEETCLSISSLTSSRTELSSLHSSATPYIIDIKTEEGI